MYEFVCKNCGKKQEVWHEHGVEKMFCDRKCWSEYQQKKRKVAEQEKRKNGLTPAKTPEEQCQKCVYGSQTGGFWGCSYFEIMDCTRHSLHPGGLPDECKEFERKRRGRKSKHKELK